MLWITMGDTANISQKTKPTKGRGIIAAIMTSICMSDWFCIIRFRLRTHASATAFPVMVVQPYASGLPPPKEKKQIATAILKIVGANLIIRSFQTVFRNHPSLFLTPESALDALKTDSNAT